MNNNSHKQARSKQTKGEAARGRCCGEGRCAGCGRGAAATIGEIFEARLGLFGAFRCGSLINRNSGFLPMSLCNSPARFATEAKFLPLKDWAPLFQKLKLARTPENLFPAPVRPANARAGGDGKAQHRLFSSLAHIHGCVAMITAASEEKCKERGERQRGKSNKERAKSLVERERGYLPPSRATAVIVL